MITKTTAWNTGIKIEKKIVVEVRDTYKNAPVCKVQTILNRNNKTTGYVTITLNEKAAEALEVISPDFKLTRTGKKTPMKFVNFYILNKTTPAIKLANSDLKTWLVKDLEEGLAMEYSFTLKVCMLSELTGMTTFASFEKRGVEPEYFELKPEKGVSSTFWLFEKIKD